MSPWIPTDAPAGDSAGIDYTGIGVVIPGLETSGEPGTVLWHRFTWKIGLEFKHKRDSDGPIP